MYNRNGEKMKKVADLYTSISIVIIGGISLAGCLVSESNGWLLVLLGILICLTIWISGMAFYALGQISENTDKIVENQKVIINLLSQQSSKMINESNNDVSKASRDAYENFIKKS